MLAVRGIETYRLWLSTARKREPDAAPFVCTESALRPKDMEKWLADHATFIAKENKRRLEELYWPEKSQLTSSLCFEEVPLSVPFGFDSLPTKCLRPRCKCCRYIFWSNSQEKLEKHCLSANHHKTQLACIIPGNNLDASVNGALRLTETRVHYQNIAKLKAASFCADHPTLSFEIGKLLMDFAASIYAPLAPLLKSAIDEATKAKIIEKLPSLQAARHGFNLSLILLCHVKS